MLSDTESSEGGWARKPRTRRGADRDMRAARAGRCRDAGIHGNAPAHAATANGRLRGRAGPRTELIPAREDTNWAIDRAPATRYPRSWAQYDAGLLRLDSYRIWARAPPGAPDAGARMRYRLAVPSPSPAYAVAAMAAIARLGERSGYVLAGDTLVPSGLAPVARAALARAETTN